MINFRFLNYHVRFINIYTTSIHFEDMAIGNYKHTYVFPQKFKELRQAIDLEHFKDKLISFESIRQNLNSNNVNSRIEELTNKIMKSTEEDMSKIMNKYINSLYKSFDYDYLSSMLDVRLSLNTWESIENNKSFTNLDKTLETLLARSKYKELNYNQIKLLHKLLNQHGDKRDQFWYLFQISQSNIYGIKRLSLDHEYNQNDVMRKEKEFCDLISSLSNLLNPPKYPMWMCFITEKINSERNTNYSKSYIAKIVKKKTD